MAVGLVNTVGDGKWVTELDSSAMMALSLVAPWVQTAWEMRYLKVSRWCSRKYFRNAGHQKNFLIDILMNEMSWGLPTNPRMVSGILCDSYR